MRVPALLFAACLTFGSSLIGAQAMQGPEAPPTFEMKGAKRDSMNFLLRVRPISNPKLTFTQFKGRKTLVFYFSAQCPHCQHAAPFVQRLADELGAKGFASVAIAITSNDEDDIRGFIRDFGLRMPVMQDDDRAFAQYFRVNTIPAIFVVNERGEYVRYQSFDPDVTPAQIRTVAASWTSAKTAKPRN